MAKEKTMAQIYEEMTPEQQVCVAYYVNKAIEELEKKVTPPANETSK